MCSYVEADPYPLVSISSLFDGIAGPHIMHLIESIKWQKNGILLNNKFRILERINHMKQSIYSEMIDALKFGAGEKISFKVCIIKLSLNYSQLNNKIVNELI